jgi:hypothetical protein
MVGSAFGSLFLGAVSVRGARHACPSPPGFAGGEGRGEGGQYPSRNLEM